MRFEPSGWSGNPKIGYAKSLTDYIGRWLDLKFLSGDQIELFKALPMPVQPAIEANRSNPVGTLGELVQMGDAARLQHLRFADGAQRDVLPLHDVREHERMLVAATRRAKTSIIGGLVGLVLALPLPRVFSAMFFDLHAGQPWIYVVVAITILLVVIAATYIPAHRAAHVDPMRALWQE